MQPDQKKKTTRKRSYKKKKPGPNILASGCCDLSQTHRKARPFFDPVSNIDTYITQNDLFLEPTQRRLELSSDMYVGFLDNSNNLLDEITSIYNTSPTCHAIIDQKTQMSLGDGFTLIKGKETKMLAAIAKMRQPAELSDEALMSLNEYLHKVNPEGETMQDIALKIFSDYWTYGNAFVELIRSEVEIDGSTEKWLVVRHIRLDHCRPKKIGKGEIVVKTIGISDRWQENENMPQDIVNYPIYPNFAEVDGLEGERSIIHLKAYSPGFTYWGLPDWIACFLWGEMEYRIPKYNQSKFVNGFTPSALITLFASMTPEEAQDWVDGFTKSFTNTGNNSKMFAQVLRDDTAKADVQILEDKNEGNFMNLSELAKSNIITAHRWTPALAGKSVAGELGSNQQIRSELEIVQNTVIKPAQALVLTKVLNPIMCEASEWMQTDWQNTSLDIVSTMPVSFLGDLDPNEILTLNEKRQQLGLEPLEGGDSLTDQNAPQDVSSNDAN